MDVSTSSTPVPGAHSHRRGNRGKDLRARGRRGSGRPAEWRREDHEKPAVDEHPDEEVEDAGEGRFAHRALVSNADRYMELEQADDVDTYQDLLTFRARKLSTGNLPIGSFASGSTELSDQVDRSLSHLPSSTTGIASGHKTTTVSIQWDEEIESMWREKQRADAIRDLKTRFKGNAQQPALSPLRATSSDLPVGTMTPAVDTKEEEAFLDELLG